MTDAAGPGDGAAAAERPAGEDAGEAGARTSRGPGRGSENLAEWPDPAEPTELIAMTEPVDMAEPVEDGPAGQRRPRRRWQSVLIALGFLVAAAAIIGGAIAIVGSLTHGFKKPVVIHYKKSAIFSLKTGQCIDPNGQTATVVSCSAPHDAEVFATFALPGSKWPGTAAVGTAASSGCSDPAQRVPEPAARDQPRVDLHLPRLGGLAGRHADRDLRGAGDEGAAHGVGARGLGDRRVARGALG